MSVTTLDACFVLRGYVTSVGRPSLDLGIPVGSRQPKQMLRECRVSPLEYDISEDFLDKIDEYLEDTVEIGDIQSHKEWHPFLLSEDNEINIKKESVFDKLGKSRLDQVTCPSNVVHYGDFLSYMRSLKHTLAANIDNKITFVI